MCHRSFDLHYHSISQRGDELPVWEGGMLSRVFLLLQPSFTGNKFRLDIHSLKRKKKGNKADHFDLLMSRLWSVFCSFLETGSFLHNSLCI